MSGVSAAGQAGAGSGGTQYTEGDTDASITGNAILWEDTSDTLRTVSAAKPLPVSTTLAAGTNNIGDVDVLTLPAIPTGTNTIGSVKITDGTDVADVLDLTSSNPLAVALVDTNGDQISSFGGGTQYTEDAAAAANPVGTALNLIRADALGALTTADGDNVAARGTDKGELYVKHADTITVASHAVTNAGTFAVQAAQSGTWTVQPGNTANTTAWKVDASSVAVPITDNSGSITVDGTFWQATQPVSIASVPSHAVTNAGTFAVQATEADGANVTLGAKADAKSTATDTTAITLMQVAKQISASVQAPPSQAVTNAGTFATQSAITAASASIASGAIASGAIASGAIASGAIASGALASGSIAAGAITKGATSIAANEDDAFADLDTGVKVWAVRKNTAASTSGSDGDYQPFITNTTGHLWVDASGQTLTVGSHAVTNAGTFAVQAAGDVAHDGVDSGNPVKIGFQARQTNPAAISTDGDRVNAIADDLGRQVVILNQVRDLVGTQATTITSSTTETTIVSAAGSGVFADLTHLTITNSSATALIVTLKDDTAGTTRGIFALAANGGIVLTFPTPKVQAVANKPWTITCGTSVASIYIMAEYVKNI